MTDEEIRATVLRALRRVAPEADLGSIDPAADLREQFDIDSMDALTFMLGVNEAFGVEIPERDYPQLASLDDCVSYVQASLAAGGPAAAS